MSEIRKDSAKAATSEPQRSGEVRRSRRDRVPNNKYAESIEEMYRSMAGRDRRLDRALNSEESSWSHRKPQDEQMSRHEGNNDWLKCFLPQPDSKGRLIDLEIVIPRPPRRKASEYSELRRQPRKKSEDEQQVVDQPRRIIKRLSDNQKPNKAGGLLEMLMLAAEKAANAPEQELREKMGKEEEEGEEGNGREVGEDVEGKIIKVRQYQDKVIFQHSKNGQIEVPMLEEREPAGVESPQHTSIIEFKNLERCFNEYKKRVHTPLILS